MGGLGTLSSLCTTQNARLPSLLYRCRLPASVPAISSGERSLSFPLVFRLGCRRSQWPSPSLRGARGPMASVGGGRGGIAVSAASEDLGRDGEVFRKTLRLVECAMFASVSALAYLLSNSLALENYLGCFFALPVVISAMRWGLAAGRKTMVATAVLLLTLAGPVKASTYLTADKLGSINCSVLSGPCTGSCGFCPCILILNKGKYTFSNHHKHACHLGIHVFIYWDKCSNHGRNIRYLRSSAHDKLWIPGTLAAHSLCSVPYQTRYEGFSEATKMDAKGNMILVFYDASDTFHIHQDSIEKN